MAAVGAAADAAGDGAPPRPEKFHWPDGELINMTWGSSSRNDSTCRLRETKSDIRSTPTLTDLAVTKGALLNAGSSAIDRSSSAIPPESSAVLMFPIDTLRPRASLIALSSCGRN